MRDVAGWGRLRLQHEKFTRWHEQQTDRRAHKTLIESFALLFLVLVMLERIHIAFADVRVLVKINYFASLGASSSVL
jgi:hypothetical protein